MAGETLMNEAGATTEADAAPEQSAEAKRIEQLEKSLSRSERKNQEFESRFAHLEGRLEQAAVQPQARTQAQVSEEDEDAKFFEKPSERSRRLAREELQRYEASRQNEELMDFNARCEITAEQQIDEIGAEKWDEIEHEFARAASRDLKLKRALRVAPDPAAFARRYVEKRRVSGSASARAAALEAENAELRKQVDAARKGVAYKPTLPATNAGARNVGKITAPLPDDAKSRLADILSDD